MVKWKKSTLLTKLVSNKKPGFEKMQSKIYGKPKKFKPKPVKVSNVKKGRMKIVEVEPELHYRQGYQSEERGIYKR